MLSDVVLCMVLLETTLYNHVVLSNFDFFLASSDNIARLWCVETGEVKREYSGHQKAVVCLAFRDDTS